MADENKNALQRGVVVEFDFTAIDGSQLLFETAKKVLKGHGVDLTVKLEAMRLVGGNYQGGLSELFEFLGSKADAAKVAQELAEAFRAALGAALALFESAALGGRRGRKERRVVRKGRGRAASTRRHEIDKRIFGKGRMQRGRAGHNGRSRRGRKRRRRSGGQRRSGGRGRGSFSPCPFPGRKTGKGRKPTEKECRSGKIYPKDPSAG